MLWRAIFCPLNLIFEGIASLSCRHVLTDASCPVLFDGRISSLPGTSVDCFESVYRTFFFFFRSPADRCFAAFYIRFYPTLATAEIIQLEFRVVFTLKLGVRWVVYVSFLFGGTRK